MDEYKIERFSKTVPMDDFIANCVDIPRFAKLCEVCPNYGRNWMCPPFDFDPLQLWNSYGRITITAEKIIPDRRRPETGTSAVEYASRLLAPEKEKLVKEFLEEEKKIPGSGSFFAGNCRLCASCAKADGLPCRRPCEARHSIESLGADAGLAIKRYLGLEIKWIAGDELPEYLTLVCALCS